ncbi:MAG: MG2 domain-containing protein [Saprospiraceae bacterium]
MQNLKSWFALFFVACSILVILPSCKKENRARQMPESVNAYVYAYTSGVISRANPIRVRFASAVATPEEIGQEANGILSFSPAIAGKASWEDQMTLRFDPETPLPSATSYLSTVQLKKLFDQLPSDAQVFEFDFRTKDQYFDLTFNGLFAPNTSALEKQAFRGTLFTADVAEPEKVIELLSATQRGKNLDIEWTHDGENREHQFTIKDIQRSDKAAEVLLSWNGRPLNVDLKGERKIEVPALGDFKVTETTVVRGADQYILLNFSDPLQEKQDLNGLITMADFNGNFRFIVENNQIRVYPSSRIAGERVLLVNAGVKNSMGKRMEKPSEWFIKLEDVKPEVRLVGQGVILPNSDGLIFPFEAISLNAVEVEVFKIFNNNILQFLQSNRIDGLYDLGRVGRVILQKKVDLKQLNPNASAGDWTRYALDLSKLIEADEEAIYQIRIGFRSSYTNYFCGNNAGSSNETTLLPETDNFDEEGNIVSIMDGWYGLDGYYEDYNWNDRDDPCKPAYYNSDRFVSRNVLSSNLGLIAKGGNDNSYFIAISDIRTASPVSGAELEFFDYQQQSLRTVQTDAKGMANVQLDRKPFIVVARKGTQKGYLKLQDGDALSLSRFDVSGQAPQKGLKGFIYGDRGVWRPGDSIYLNFVLEDRNAKLPPNYPISLEVYDPRGQLQVKYASADNAQGLYPLPFSTAVDAPTGNWRAEVKAGGATFSKLLKVETIKPNRLKIDLDFGKTALRKTDEPLQGKLAVNWLHGAPASDLNAKVELQLRAVKTSFDTYADYTFDDPARAFEEEPRTIFDGALSQDGKATVNASLLGNVLVPGKMVANIKTRVFEKGGDFSTDNFSIPYHPYNAYAGIGLPKKQWGEKRLDIDKASQIDFVVVDPEGKPVSNHSLNVGIYRINWRWWWDYGYDEVSRYNSTSHYDATQKTSLSTNAKGEANWNLTISEWGRYLVRVCDEVSGHCSGDYFYVGYPWYGEENDQNRSALAMLAFSSDKTTYEVGESVKLTIPTGEAGKALITIENGTKVLESFWADAKSGENTFSFNTTAEMAPTVYAHVSLIQPHAQVNNDLPIRMYGVIPVSVEDANTKLEPVLAMPEELQPEKSFELEVKEAKGKPMAYTIAVVDEGLLGLTRFKTPNPWDHFYAREALGVKTWDMYDQVLGAHGGQLERILTIGGDGEITPGEDDNQANRFKPVVMHLGPFQLPKGKKAKHTITLPNYIGAVRTMVVAAGEGAYGAAEKSTPVRKPLMVLATLPRVLGPGERIQLPVNVFAMTDKVNNATIQLEEKSGLAQIIGPASQQIRFSKPGDQLVSFEIQMKEAIGVARFVVKAQGGGENTQQEIEIQVRNPNPYVTNVLDKVLAAGESWNPSFRAAGMPGTNEGVLEISNIPPINLGKRLDYLLHYPYGCLEQTLSSGFPQLYVNKLMELDENQKKKVPANIQATIDRLKLFQTSQGGFAYWPGEANPNHWSSSYAGHFLLEAKALGYTLPSGMLDRWVDFQNQVAKKWNLKDSEYGFYSEGSAELSQAYRLYTLALAGKANLSAMNRLRESKKLSKTASWQLAAAYALAGKPEVANAIVEKLDTEVADYVELSYTFGSGLRDRAMILETLVLLDKKTQAATLVKYISERLSSSSWYNTQAISFSLLAIGKFVGDSDVNKSFKYAYQIGGGQTVNGGSNSPIVQIKIPIDDGNIDKVMVKNEENSTLFARVILRGQPVAGLEDAAASNLKIAVQYKNTNGNAIDPSTLTQGSDFIAEVTITNPGSRGISYEEMALNQIFPSGWEILNTRMDEVQNFKAISRPDYQDFRDDRVYTFFDIPEGKSRTFRVQLTAAYQGRFYLPAVSCEAMYDQTINARAEGRWVEVVQPAAG